MPSLGTRMDYLAKNPTISGLVELDPGVGLIEQTAPGDFVTTSVASVAGSYIVATSAVSYTETAVEGRKIVLITASGQTVTLPTAVGNAAELTFILTVAGSLILDGAGAETINGGATATLVSQFESVTLITDNANWRVA